MRVSLSDAEHMVAEPLFIPSDLNRMQSFALVALYLQSIGANHAAWLVTGYAIRCAVDVGLHREKVGRIDIS